MSVRAYGMLSLCIGMLVGAVAGIPDASAGICTALAFLGGMVVSYGRRWVEGGWS